MWTFPQSVQVCLKGKKLQNDKSKFRILSALDVMNEAPEKVPCIVEGLLPLVGVSMLCAKPKVGKSSYARQLSVCIAEGRDFLGHSVTSGNVLYVNLEGPKDVLGSHLRKLGYTQTQGKIHVVDQRMPATGEEALKGLADVLAELRPQLVVIDPVIKFLRLLDSDKNDLVSPAIEALEVTAKKFATQIMMLVHGKKRATDDPGDAPLGSSGFRGGTDTNIFLMKQGQQRVLTTEQRWGTSLEPTAILWNETRCEMSLGRSIEEMEE